MACDGDLTLPSSFFVLAADIGFSNDGDFFKHAATEKAAAEDHKEKVKAHAEAEKAKAHEKKKEATAAEAAEKHKEANKEHKKEFNKDFNANLHENETDALEKVKAFHNHEKKANVEFKENFAEHEKQKHEEAVKHAKQAAFKAHEAAADKHHAEEEFKKG
jgi:hypothetical protein